MMMLVVVVGGGGGGDDNDDNKKYQHITDHKFINHFCSTIQTSNSGISWKPRDPLPTGQRHIQQRANLHRSRLGPTNVQGRTGTSTGDSNFIKFQWQKWLNHLSILDMKKTELILWAHPWIWANSISNLKPKAPVSEYSIAKVNSQKLRDATRDVSNPVPYHVLGWSLYQWYRTHFDTPQKPPSRILI